MFLRGVCVGDEHGDEKKDEANPGERAKARKQKAGSAEKFQDAGDVNDEKRLWEK